MRDLRSSQRWQLLVFVGAVLVPSAALVVVGQRTLKQNAELAGKHRLDQARADRERVARQMLARLEALKSEAAAKPDAPPEAVALVARLEAGHLVMPWERELDSHRFRGWPPDAVLRGNRAEFSGDLASAVASYSEALRESADSFQSTYVRFLLAGALKKQRRMKEAGAEARRVLDAPPDMMDEDRIPLSVRAAALLLDSTSQRPAVRRALMAVMERMRWHSPNANFTMSELANQLQQLAPNEDPGWSTDFSVRLSAANRLYEQAEALQNGPALHATEVPSWMLHAGAEPWLVSTEPPLVIAVRAQEIFGPIETAEKLRFLGAADPGGELLADSFPGLKVRFTVPAEPPPNRLAGTFYSVALLVLVGATGFGASLLWRSLRREVELAETRAQFVASVSHELKTPLTAIRMFAETLQMGRSDDESVRQEYLETITSECDRLSRLVDDVLLFSKIEQGKAPYRFRPVALADVIQKAARTLAYPLAQHGFELRLEISDDVPDVNADPDALEQAVLNLLANAMKYSDTRKEIELRLKRLNGDAAIQVTDYGMGIAPEDLPRIFEKYYRAPTAENRSIPGAGLGLTLVAQIAKAHGGGVDVKSATGQGSTFTLHLPLRKES